MNKFFSKLNELKIALHKKEAKKDLIITKQGTPECFEDMPLKVHWELTEACNYRCSYCFNRDSGYEDNNCSLKEAETAIKHLAEANRPSYQVSLLGGEPTSHPYLPDIIRLLSDNLGNRLERISIITNGSFNDKTTDAILAAAAKTCIEVKVSMHFEFLKMEKIRKLIERLSKDTRLLFLVMFHPGLFKEVSAAVEELCELRHDYSFDMAIKLLRDPDKSSNLEEQYTEAHRKWIDDAEAEFKKTALNSVAAEPAIPKEAGWEFLVEGSNKGQLFAEKGISTNELEKLTGCHFTGMTCCVGTSVIDIKPDGLTRGLVCGLAKDKYNIYKENPFRRDGIIDSVLCTKKRCNCNVDWRTPKYLSKADAEEFIRLCRDRQQQLMDDFKR